MLRRPIMVLLYKVRLSVVSLQKLLVTGNAATTAKAYFVMAAKKSIVLRPMADAWKRVSVLRSKNRCRVLAK